MLICDNGCNRSSSNSSRSRSSSSNSDSSSSSSKDKKSKKKKKAANKKDSKKESKRVAAARAKAEKRKSDAFAKAAQRETQKKDRERARIIQLASTMNAKIKKALRPLKDTVTNPRIIHVPHVTLQPLVQVIESWEAKIATLELVEKGELQWHPSMSEFSAKDGQNAVKPVVAVLGVMAKYKR